MCCEELNQFDCVGAVTCEVVLVILELSVAKVYWSFSILDWEKNPFDFSHEIYLF